MGVTKQYDFAITGSGVAGLHLAFELSKNSFFDNKQIAIIDQNFAPKFNRVLSYWEVGAGQWDAVVSSSWRKANFISSNIDLCIELDKYTYKSLNFNDFSSFCLKQIKRKSNFTFFESEVTSVIENKEGSVDIALTDAFITASFVFDSRISEDYLLNRKKYPSVIQSFKGFEVEFEEAVFDKESFTMMDYRQQWKASNSFMYILPASNKKALLEYTFFAPFIISDSEIDLQIKNYISTFFKGKKYKILSSEKGEIPMSTYPFKSFNSNKVLKIGTAGGWVKASTGYSFKYAGLNAKIIANQIINQQPIKGKPQSSRFRFYDKLFIKVLQNQNTKGPIIFEKMYQKVSPNKLFRFLDEETTIVEEVSIILKLPYLPFLKELF